VRVKKQINLERLFFVFNIEFPKHFPPKGEGEDKTLKGAKRR
jgi:hypothetical protein